MHQIAVDEPDDDIGHLRLRLQCLTKPHLNIYAETETTGYGEYNGKNRDNGQQGAVCQCCCSGHHPFGQKEANGQNQFFRHLHQQELDGRNILCLDSPYSSMEKLDELLYLFCHIRSLIKKWKALPL